MAIEDSEIRAAEERMTALRQAGHAVAARHDRERQRLVLELDSGVEISIPVAQIQGLGGAASADLDEIEISPSGLGLHWPRLDADVYVPALLEGVFGSRRWMARGLGAAGGQARSPGKAAAARANGRKGGRPAKKAAG